MTTFAAVYRGDLHASGRGRRTFGTYALWGAQIVLAALFLFAGGAKLAMPVSELSDQSGLPGAFMRFIATAELLGGIGLIVPAWLRIRPGLTPLAALGLVIIMIGAVALSIADRNVAAAILPAAVGIAAALVAWHRRAWLATLHPSLRFIARGTRA